MIGMLYGVGVGPGDPELMTIKALRCIEMCDVMVLPSFPKEECYAYQIVRQIYEGIDEKEIICMPFLMVKDKERLRQSHDAIYENIALLLNEGKRVAFLTIGDPSIYSTYYYIHKRVIAHGGSAQMISGVPSFCAGASALGISLGEKQDEIHVIPGSYQIEDSLALSGTKIYMKSGKNIGTLKRLLLEEKHRSQFDVYGISNCGLGDEKQMFGVEQLDEDSGYMTLVIVKDKKETDG